MSDFESEINISGGNQACVVGVNLQFIEQSVKDNRIPPPVFNYRFNPVKPSTSAFTARDRNNPARGKV
jgi:hypothetical protein